MIYNLFSCFAHHIEIVM